MFEDVIRDAFNQGFVKVGEFIPELVGAVIVFLIGWLIAELLGRAAYHIVKILGVNRALVGLGLGKGFERGGLKLDVPKFFYELVKWFFIIIFLIAATDILGLPQFTEFLTAILLYIPHVLAAALILLASALIAKFLSGLVRSSVKAAKLHAANFLATVTKWSVMVFGILAALIQLKVASDIIEIIIIGVVAGGALAFGLSFGLGGRDMAKDIIKELREKIEG